VPPVAHLGRAQAAERRRQSGRVAGSVAVVVGDPAAGCVSPTSLDARLIPEGEPRSAATGDPGPRWEPCAAPEDPQLVKTLRGVSCWRGVGSGKSVVAVPAGATAPRAVAAENLACGTAEAVREVWPLLVAEVRAAAVRLSSATVAARLCGAAVGPQAPAVAGAGAGVPAAGVAAATPSQGAVTVVA
jgi:hypothetical protein